MALLIIISRIGDWRARRSWRGTYLTVGECVVQEISNPLHAHEIAT